MTDPKDAKDVRENAREDVQEGGPPARRAGGLRAFARGAGEALGVMALFVVGGLGLAAALEPGSAPSAAPTGRYAPGVAQPASLARVWLVDGYNVLQVGLLAGRAREGWWSSRFRNELIGRAASFEEPDAEIWVVFDGARPEGAPEAGRVRSVFAPDADEWLLARIAEGGSDPVVLVTADRRLAERARRRGAEVVAPAVFLARCPASLGA